MTNRRFLVDIIKHPPVQSLSECLEMEGNGWMHTAVHYKLIHLWDLASPEYIDEVSLMNQLLTLIPDKFSEHILFFSPAELKMLEQTINCMKKNQPLPDDSDLITLARLQLDGYLYIFEWEEKLWAVLPHELWPEWEAAAADEDLQKKQKHCQEVMTYAKGLSSLYGLCDFQQFVNIWNRQHKDKISTEYAISILHEAQSHQGEFFLEDDWIVSDSIDEEMLDDLLDAVAELPYYTPDISVVIDYAANAPFGQYSEEAKRLHAFFQRILSLNHIEREDLDSDVAMACEQNWSSEILTKILLDCDFPIQDDTLLQEFNGLYRSLWNNTRQWALRGHTPAEARALDMDVSSCNLPCVPDGTSK